MTDYTLRPGDNSSDDEFYGTSNNRRSGDRYQDRRNQGHRHESNRYGDQFNESTRHTGNRQRDNNTQRTPERHVTFVEEVTDDNPNPGAPRPRPPRIPRPPVQPDQYGRFYPGYVHPAPQGGAMDYVTDPHTQERIPVVMPTGQQYFGYPVDDRGRPIGGPQVIHNDPMRRPRDFSPQGPMFPGAGFPPGVMPPGRMGYDDGSDYTSSGWGSDEEFSRYSPPPWQRMYDRRY